MSSLDTSLPIQLLDPSSERNSKPRESGITMIIDKGLGLNEYTDLLQLSSSHIDYIKLGFGTCVLYPKPLLLKKIELAKRYQVKIYPGGTMAEIAIANNSIDSYMQYVKDIGFSAIEISEGTIDINPAYRYALIEKALKLDLEVITEFGKKEQGHRIDPSALEEQLHADLAVGVSYVIVEGRESGKDVGLFDHNGEFIDNDLERLFNKGEIYNRLVWEAPLKNQQVHLISQLGPNVNLGNIATNETIALEALRRGLRSDTFKGNYI